MEDIEKVSAVHNFLELNGLLDQTPLAQFRAEVSYSPNNLNDKTTVQVNTDTFNYGNVEVIETPVLSLKVLHLGFNLHYVQSIKLDGNDLIINDIANHLKGGKPFEVRKGI